VLDTVGLPSPTQAFLFNGEAPCAPRSGCVVEWLLPACSRKMGTTISPLSSNWRRLKDGWGHLQATLSSMHAHRGQAT
jgi:hypothetical protein